MKRATQKRKAPCARTISTPAKRKCKKKLIVPSSDDDGNDCSNVKECEHCNRYKEQIKQLQKQLHYLKTLRLHKQHKPFSIHMLRDDAKVKTYTGLPSKELFDGLFGSFGNKVQKIRKWKGPAEYKSIYTCKKKSTIPFLTAKEEYFIALFHMKTMLKAEIVGDLFGISWTTVSQICLTWWKFMAHDLKPLLNNPSDEAHRALLPASFQTPKYNRVQHIIDCTKVFTETPKNKNNQAKLWSNYKHHYTCKYLISIAPHSFINFVSKGYGGRASDRQIVELSGFMNEIREGEKIMADKGFNISDLLAL